MWQVDNQTPYEVKGSWIRNRQGEEVRITVLKATWDIFPDGTTALSTRQSPVNTGPVLQDDGRTLLYDTDCGPAKNATDIVLNGHAYSPDGKAVCDLPIGLKVGGVTRLARVYGERQWDGRKYTPPSLFTRMQLSYDKMNRGEFFSFYASHYNPDGIPVDAVPETEIPALPQIEFYGDETTPGFGVQPRYWPGRMQFAGTYNDNWRRHRAPLPPDNMDERYWQSAPAPLYAGGWLNSGETVCLGNLTPPGYGQHGLLVFTLPRVIPAFRTQFYDGSVRRHRAKLHTVIIEPDFPRVSLVWHSALPCHRLVNQLESTTVYEKQRLFIRTKALPVNFPEWEALL